MTDQKAPFKSLDFVNIISYAIGIAIREASLDGLLTRETADRISERADELKNALVAGKVVEIGKTGAATIRDATSDEEAEMAPEDFPLHHKSKTSLDI